MLENPETELAPGASLPLHVTPFEVITLRLKVKNG